MPAVKPNNTKMIQMQNFKNKLAAAALACLTLASVACDNDDKENPGQQLSLGELTGSYTGTFDFLASPSDLNPDPQPQTGIAVTFEVTDEGTVHFPEFPAAELVKALIGEEEAATLLPLLGTISYDATIGTPTADESQLTAALTTPQLRIDLSGIMVVLITIDSPEPLSYTKEGAIRFTFKTTKCQLGEGEEAGEPFDLINTLEFTAKKQ